MRRYTGTSFYEREDQAGAAAEPAEPQRRIWRPWWDATANIRPRTIASTAIVFPVSVIDSAADSQLFINGIPVAWEAAPGDSSASASIASLASAKITKILGQAGSFVFTILSSAVASRPAPFDEVIFYRYGIRRFAGFITKVDDSLVVSTNLSEYGITCADYNSYLDRVILAKKYTISTGSLVWIIVFDIVQGRLGPAFGITYQFEGDPLILLGAVLFHYAKASAAIASILTGAPGWYVNIDAFKQLHLKQQGTGTAAPYSLSDAVRNFQTMLVSIDAGKYANKRWVIPSVNIAAFRTDTFTGDGSTRGFFPEYPLNSAPTVELNGNRQVVTELGSWGSYFDWYYIPGGQGVFQNPANAPIGGGDTLAVTYPSPFQLGVSAENDTEIALHGLVEDADFPSNIINDAQAQNLADGELAAFCPDLPEVIKFVTNEEIETVAGGWLEPGQMINISTTNPKAAGGAYLVQEIDSVEEDLTLWSHTITVRKQNGATDEQATMAKLLQRALTAPNNYATETAAIELASTVNGLTNPGASLSHQPPNRYTVENAGVLDHWSLLAAVSPPTGADLKVDIKLNGVSIFPAGVYATLPDGQTTEAQGNNFASLNLAVVPGDEISWQLIQVGSTFGGADILSKLVWRI